MNLVLLCFTSAIALVAVEIGLRVLPISNRLSLRSDERTLSYRYDANLGWFPAPNTENTYTGTRTFRIKNNSRGFRDSEHVVGEKPRMMVLGDSFVWGYDVEQEERFTEKLASLLPKWSIYNLGVSGYGTDQEFLLFRNQYAFYRPDIVFLVFCSTNDRVDNTHNNRYGGYYKPYFVSASDNLIEAGTPVPQSENYFFANHGVLARSYSVRLLSKLYFRFHNPRSMQIDDPTERIIATMESLAIQNGIRLFVGLTDGDSRLEAFLEQKEIPFVLLETDLRYPERGRHWTPEGHAVVAKKIQEFLQGHQAIPVGPVSNSLQSSR